MVVRSAWAFDHFTLAWLGLAWLGLGGLVIKIISHRVIRVGLASLLVILQALLTLTMAMVLQGRQVNSLLQTEEHSKLLVGNNQPTLCLRNI